MIAKNQSARGFRTRPTGPQASPFLRLGDLALVANALAGGKKATARILKRMSCIPRFIDSITKGDDRVLGPEERTELAQEALVRFWLCLHRFEGRSTLETWAFAVCRNTHLEARRNTMKTNQNVIGLSDALVSQRLGDDAVDEAPSASELASIRQAAEQLPRTLAEVVRLRHMHNLSFIRIAGLIGVPCGTVKGRYYRGIEQLKARLHRGVVGRALK